MDQYLEVLKRTRVILSDPKAWTQDFFARDKHGRECSPNSERACQWCLFGAVRRASFDDICQNGGYDQHVGETSVKVVKLIEGYLNGYHPPSWNDAAERTHSDVTAMLDGLISKMESEHAS